MSVQYFEGIGRRKQSIARVRIMAGSGRFIVNEKEAPAFFNRLGRSGSHFGSDEGGRSGCQIHTISP